MAITRSPRETPARAIGDPGVTRTTTGAFGSPGSLRMPIPQRGLCPGGIGASAAGASSARRWAAVSLRHSGRKAGGGFGASAIATTKSSVSRATGSMPA